MTVLFHMPTSLDAKASDVLDVAVQVGVANIREYETRHLQAAEAAHMERTKLKGQVRPATCKPSTIRNIIVTPSAAGASAGHSIISAEYSSSGWP